MTDALPGKWTQLGDKNNFGWSSVAVAGFTDFIAVGEQFSWRWWPNGWVSEVMMPLSYSHNRMSTLTTLPDGTLLAIGTDLDGKGRAAAARYSVERRVWTPTNPPNVQRQGQGVTSQTGESRKVMVAGGTDFSNAQGTSPDGMTTCEWYLPESNSWSPAPSLNEPRYAPAMVTLADGVRMMAFGGAGIGSAELSSVEMYNGEKWTPAPPMPLNAKKPSAVTLRDGRVVVTADIPYVLVFDPGKFAWEEPVRLVESADTNLEGWLPIGELKDGTVLVNRDQIYDPVARVCRPVTPMPTRLEGDEGYCSTPDGGVLMLGGILRDQVAMKFNID